MRNLNLRDDFPIYGLPPTVQNAIREVAKKRQAPIEFAIAPALTALATAIGSKAKVDEDYTNGLNLFVGVIGESSENKSCPAEDLLRPLWEIDMDLSKEYEFNLSCYDIEMEERRNGKGKGKGTDNKPNERPKGKGTDNKPNERPKGKGTDNKPIERPKEETLITNQNTPEARLIALKNSPFGILWCRDELSALIKDFNRYNESGEAQDLLSIYHGTPFKTQTKTGGTIHIPNPHLSIYGGIQPKILTDIFRKTTFLDNGLIPRFIWFCSSKRTKKDYSVNDKPHLAKWSGLIKDIYDKSKGNKLPSSIKFGDGVRSLLDTYRNESGNYFSGYEGCIMQKLHYIVYKLSGIAAIARYVEYGSTGECLITKDDMLWAIQCANYFRNTHMYVERLIRGTPEGEEMTKEKAIKNLLSVYPDTNQAKLASAIGVKRQYINKCKSKVDG